MITFDPIVSNILGDLTSMAIEKIKEEVALVAGAKDEVEKLREKLKAIQAVLDEAELKRLKKDAITTKAWLDKLKKAAYDIEDVLDKWDTAMLLMSLDEKTDHSSPAASSSSPSKKVRKFSFLPSCWFGARKVGLRHEIGSKIKTLNEKLDNIDGLKNTYHLDSVADIGELVENHKTTSIINMTEVKGRTEDKIKLINMLLSESSETQVPLTISLVGVGGLGKTTLAKLAFNDCDVEAHFAKRIWVCVSEPFSETRIAKAILESLKGANSSFDRLELQTLLKEIEKSIEGSSVKFLLVLDDVWNKERRKWEQLQGTLLRGAPGSRILVTTRNVEVAKIMGSKESGIFRVGLLSEEECWSIFSLHAFSDRTERECEQLQGIGRKIVDKCKGLPLAAKTLGGLLQFKNTKEAWQSVLDSELWKLEEKEEVETDLFAILYLSYYDLSLPIRRCFSYCATFPKDHWIVKDYLIDVWMAQGFLREMPNKDMRIVGEEYFRSLAMRSLFQDFEEDKFEGCKMHDIVHDFAQLISKDECFGIETCESEEPNKSSVNEEARHLWIEVRNYHDTLPSFLYDLEKLRSLFIHLINREKPMIVGDTLFNKMTCLRSLKFCGFMVAELPSSIGKLIHLRSLDLSGNSSLRRLPDAICDLINLQILDVSGTYALVGLPQRIGKLINLRYLRNEDCKFPLPKGIERLSCLRRLDVFNIGLVVEENASLIDLKHLKNLRGSLVISWLRKVADVEEVKEAKVLKEIDCISVLTLDFDYLWEASPIERKKDKELFEALELSPKLECLTVRHYDGPTVFPNWMVSLTNLRRLEISNCHIWEYFPPLGKLPALESLKLRDIYGVEKVGNEFMGVDRSDQTMSSLAVAFPKLEILKFSRISDWEEWDIDVQNSNGNIVTIMPRITELEIYLCKRFKKLPGHLRHLTTLQHLTIDYCSVLRPRCQMETGEYWPIISHIPNIKIDGRFVQQEGKPIAL